MSETDTMTYQPYEPIPELPTLTVHGVRLSAKNVYGYDLRTRAQFAEFVRTTEDAELLMMRTIGKVGLAALRAVFPFAPPQRVEIDADELARLKSVDAKTREIIAELDRLNGYGGARMVPLFDAIEDCRALVAECAPVVGTSGK